MATGDTPSCPRLVVVGDESGSFARETAHLAGRYNLAVSFCDDVYLAAAELGRHLEGCLGVAGRFRELTRDKGDFLALLARRGVPCCGLLDGAVQRQEVLTAVRRGVRLAGGMAEIREFLEDCLGTRSGRTPQAGPEPAQTQNPAFLQQGDRATEAEIEALLGQDSDE